MISFPNCKINLGLNITEKRKDGYHNLETVFYPVPFYDVMEIITTPKRNRVDDFSFSTSGLKIEGSSDDNLCAKAYMLLKRNFPSLPPAIMHLHKIIPMGAGLGGGSADAAFVIKMLNEKFKLELSLQQMLDYALQLGSDCPFFILNKPCFASGRGEELNPVKLDISKYRIVLINPGLHVSTRDAFGLLEPRKPSESIKDIVSKPVSTWKGKLLNDFELPVFKKYPVLADIKAKLYKAGATYAAMSGSGSTMFGLFYRTKEVNIEFPAHYFSWQEK